MKAVLRDWFFVSVLILSAPCFIYAQSVGFIQIDRIDSTQIVVQSDTLNQHDSTGQRTGLWIKWSTDEVVFTQKLEHLENDSGGIAYSHSYDTLPSETILFPKIRSIGLYHNGNRIGQWLGFTYEGRLEWVLYFDSLGKFLLLNRFTNSGELALSGLPSEQVENMVHLSWFDLDGKVIKTEDVPISYLP